MAGSPFFFALLLAVVTWAKFICAAEHPHKPRCTTSNYHEGSWREGPLVEDFACATQKIGRNCALVSAEEKYRVAQALRWEWVPRTCKLYQFSANHLHKILKNGARLVFVGDSVQGDMASSMKCLLGLSHSSNRQVLFLRDDLFGCSYFKHADGHTTKQINCETAVVDAFWSSVVTEHEIGERDFLIVNSGAHWYSPPAESRAMFETIAASIKKHHKGFVVFRTTVMGHNNCQTITRPGLPDGNESLPYNWGTFGELNVGIISAFDKADFGGRFHVLHIEMFEERGDGHVQGDPQGNKMDCLHYCTPGAIDVWNFLLFHLLNLSAPLPR